MGGSSPRVQILRWCAQPYPVPHSGLVCRDGYLASSSHLECGLVIFSCRRADLLVPCACAVRRQSRLAGGMIAMPLALDPTVIGVPIAVSSPKALEVNNDK
jgi:hypothetical protein